MCEQAFKEVVEAVLEFSKENEEVRLKDPVCCERTPDWNMAGARETSEFLGTLGLEWYSPIEADLIESQLEIIDVLICMVHRMIEQTEEPEDVASELKDMWLECKSHNLEYMSMRDMALSLMRSFINVKAIMVITLLFLTNIMKRLEMEPAMISGLLVGKLILIRFRHAYGFREGAYDKNWNGVSDSKVVYQFLMGTNMDPTRLREHLASEYSKYLKTIVPRTDTSPWLCLSR